MRHAVIMAGGAGTRLWPLSRPARPKQLLRLFEGRSLLQVARQRLSGLFEPTHIWVITSARYIRQVADELPDLPGENLIGEPLVRDTANAIGLAANLLALRDADATMAVFTADQLIRPQERFAAAVRVALEAAERYPRSLVTFGIRPRSPHTGYGYVRRGDALSPQLYRVAEFKEKPTLEVARQYLTCGDYYWNSGMFVWKVAAILDELERQLPDNAARLRELAANWDAWKKNDVAARQFEQLRKISIDYAVMEKAADVLVVEMDCEWLDLGSWAAVGETAPPDQAGNAILAARALIADGERNVVVSESNHLLVLFGVSDLVVVHSDDATLVCRRDRAQEVKELVEQNRSTLGTCDTGQMT